MPRSFLIVNKRYRKKQDKNHNIHKQDTSPHPEKGTQELNNNNTNNNNNNNNEDEWHQRTTTEEPVTPLENKIKELQCQQWRPYELQSHESPLSIKSLLSPVKDNHSNQDDDVIRNPWKFPEFHSEQYGLSSLYSLRPLHHIFRQLPSQQMFFPSRPEASFQMPADTSNQYCNNNSFGSNGHDFVKGESFDQLNALVEKVFDDIDMCDVYVCDECGKTYSTSSNLARHKQIHRDISDKKARKCPHCDKVYVSMPAFSMHVRTHSQGCVCPYCGKRFSRPWLLQGHIRTHTGEKPFSCPKCSKAFADKSNLRAHIQTHSTEKPYTCGRCGKAFALKSYLSKHEESSCMRGLKYHRLHCAFIPSNL